MKRVKEVIEEHFICVMRICFIYFVTAMLIHAPLAFVGTNGKYVSLFLVVTAMLLYPSIAVFMGKNKKFAILEGMKVRAEKNKPLEGESIFPQKVREKLMRYAGVITMMFVASASIATIVGTVLYLKADITRAQYYGIVDMVAGEFFTIRCLYDA